MDEHLQRLARQVRRFALPTKEDEGFDSSEDAQIGPEVFAEEERKRLKIKKIIWASALGNVLEWYDFAIFGFLAKEVCSFAFDACHSSTAHAPYHTLPSTHSHRRHQIGHNFFPPGDEKLQIMESFGVFGGAFLMRPLGGMVFGYLGDKVVGREKALEFSIIVMAFPTVMLGCLPGYNTIGVFAPILLTLIRMVQGLAVGGQLVGSMVTVTENSPKKQLGFYGAMCLTTANGGRYVLAFQYVLTIPVDPCIVKTPPPLPLSPPPPPQPLTPPTSNTTNTTNTNTAWCPVCLGLLWAGSCI